MRSVDRRKFWLATQVAVTIIAVIAVMHSALRTATQTSRIETAAPPSSGESHVFILESLNSDGSVTQPTANGDVTQGLSLLLRTQDITSEVLSCPTTNPTKWDFGND